VSRDRAAGVVSRARWPDSCAAIALAHAIEDQYRTDLSSDELNKAWDEV